MTESSGLLRETRVSTGFNEDASQHPFALPDKLSSMASPENPENPTATLHTNHGDIVVELFEDRVPQTVGNFVGLATDTDADGDAEPGRGTGAWEDPDTGEVHTGAMYEDIEIHRVIDDFMIQTGDPTGTGRGGPGYTFDDEFHDDLSHDGAGTLSMANRGPDTNGSQFFITLAAQPHLDDRHAVFGSVIDGMDVVEEIGNLPTDGDDTPQERSVVESIGIEH
ncbi:MAG: peptidyl-prolyl cis-trans isomerase (rotamase) - cyclophilin family [uncultured archaeon A07HR60]|nr:MAG: peptidyl-prolyl cis-trans isomerase (rotamase) - cyclophilin family [uncultured archaeon A07HR60]